MNIRPNHQVTYWNKTARKTTHRDLIREEPLSIRVQRKPYSVILRTPGDEIAHVAGFCLAEGISLIRWMTVSRTALALDLASQLNITLATQSKGEGLYIFCGEHRLIGLGEG
jgi:formate dehydrogenase assembly factor FdhD